MALVAMGMGQLADAVAESQQALGLAMLQADPHAVRLDPALQLAAVSDALADGVAVATDLRKRFPGLTPQQIARNLRVPVETSGDDPMVGSIWRFAEYRSRPPSIILYSRGIAPLEGAPVKELVNQLLGQATLQDVFVAHELYHHAEAIRSEVPIARRYQPTLFRIGRWRWRTGIPSLAEIAAGAFAQSLLDLPHYPKILDFVAVDLIRKATL
jgi:hypothetical protein